MSNIGPGVSTGHGFSVTSEGVANLPNGVQADLTTAEGMAEAKAALTRTQLDELEGLMKAGGYKLDGGVFVADDSYRRSERLGGPKGPDDVEGGKSDLDDLVGEVFTKNGVPNPYNANTTPALERKLQGTQSFAAATGALTSYLENPTPAALKDFSAKFSHITKGVGNSMEALYLVFRESIKENNEDKKYFLRQLDDFNKMAKQLSNYLVERSTALGAQSVGKEYPDKEAVPVDLKTFDIAGGLDENGELGIKSASSRPLPRAALSDAIKGLESQQEEVRNLRQRATTSFQNFDQKGNQYSNLLSTVIKTIGEMGSIGAGSRSGL